MDIETALKLIDLGFTTEQIKNFDSPAPTPVVASPVAETIPEVATKSEPETTHNTVEPIDYKKLAEEVALYNQRNSLVKPIEEPKVETPPAEPPKSAESVLLNFLG